jgi:predicted methyltransferase
MLGRVDGWNSSVSMTLLSSTSKQRRKKWLAHSTGECMNVGRLVVVIDVNPSHGFWTRILMKLFGHEGK